MTAIGDDILATKELMERVGLKHRPTFRNNYLLPALKLGLIEMTIPDKLNSSKGRCYKVKGSSKKANYLRGRRQHMQINDDCYHKRIGVMVGEVLIIK